MNADKRVERACSVALDAEAIDVNLISRMIERAKENEAAESEAPLPPNVVPGRFERDAGEFKVVGR